MNRARTTTFTWNVVANEELSQPFRHEIEHEVRRLCDFSTRLDRGKHHLLIMIRFTPAGEYEVELVLRHGRFLSFSRNRALPLRSAFEGAAARLEKIFKRRRRYPQQKDQPDETRPEEAVHPVERTDRQAPRTPRELLAETLADYLQRLRRHVRRRLRTEALARPDIPVAALSDGDVVDEAIRRMLRMHPQEIPFGAFWPWAIQTCDAVLDEMISEAERVATSTVSLDEDLASVDEEDPGFDIERPLHIIDRMLFPPEEELEDATPDERTAAPSTQAEFEDFIRFLHQNLADWPDRQRRVVERYCFGGLHPEEIAASEGIDEAAVNRILNESFPRLRQLMKTAGRSASGT
ncbi:MAG: hypothetical protein ACFE0O_01950 [Opitutales bacterium]